MGSMSVKEGAFIKCARELLNRIQLYGEKSGIQEIENSIYAEIMTRRDARENLDAIYNAYYRTKEKNFIDLIRGLNFFAPAEIGTNAWFAVAYKNTTPNIYVQPRQRVNMLGKVFAVTHKEYFSFIPNSDNPAEIYEEIIRFVKTLPHLHRALYKLNFSSQPPDDIQIKIPLTLYYFFRHPDSLVIHYRNSNHGGVIRQIVLETYHANGVTLGRSIKAERGFDVEFEKDGGRVRKSHSELVSRVLAKYICNNYQNFIKMNVSQLAVWLKRNVEIVSGGSIEQILKSV